MKKYLLSLFVVPFLFIGFSDAKSYTFTSDWSWGAYTPSSVNIDVAINSLQVKEFVCDCSKCSIAWGTVPGRTNYSCSNGAGTVRCSWSGPSWTLYLKNWFWETSGYCDFKKFVLTDWQFDIYWDWFDKVLNWLTSTVNEYWPYLIYIWLGVLGVVFWFFAIKRLMNRVRAKILSMFKK